MNPTRWPAASLALLTIVAALFVGSPARADDADDAKVIRSAKILFDNKDYAGAKRSLEDILKAKPDQPEALFWTARCNEQLGELTAALKGYNRALELLRAEPNPDESLKRQALLGAQRLDEGKKLLAKYAQQMERDAERLKGRNDYAYETVMAAAKFLQSDEMETRAIDNFSKKRPPKDAVEFKGHFYLRADVPMTWHLARKACEDVGGHLVSIESAEENAFIAKLSKDPSWIGATDEEKERDWKWADGTAWKFVGWGNNQPDNHDGMENAATTSPSGRWNDLATDARLSFICEWDK